MSVAEVITMTMYYGLRSILNLPHELLQDEVLTDSPMQSLRRSVKYFLSFDRWFILNFDLSSNQTIHIECYLTCRSKKEEGWYKI